VYFDRNLLISYEPMVHPNPDVTLTQCRSPSVADNPITYSRRFLHFVETKTHNCLFPGCRQWSLFLSNFTSVLTSIL